MTKLEASEAKNSRKPFLSNEADHQKRTEDEGYRRPNNASKPEPTGTMPRLSRAPRVHAQQVGPLNIDMLPVLDPRPLPRRPAHCQYNATHPCRRFRESGEPIVSTDSTKRAFPEHDDL